MLPLVPRPRGPSLDPDPAQNAVLPSLEVFVGSVLRVDQDGARFEASGQRTQTRYCAVRRNEGPELTKSREFFLWMEHTAPAHPHLHRFFREGAETDAPVGGRWMVLEAACPSGLSLDEVETALPLPQALGYCLQLWSAVAYLHAGEQFLGRILPYQWEFRDDAGTSLLLTGNGLRTVRWVQTKNVALGSSTLPFMEQASPEEVRTASIKDPRSDQSPLAVVLYRLLTGANPVDAESAAELILRRLKGMFVPLTDRLPTVLPAVDAVFRRMYAMEPEQRFNDVHEAILALYNAAPQELEQWFNEARPRTFLQRLLRPDRTRWPLVQAELPVSWLTDRTPERAEEAWELLFARGLLPPSWGDGAVRTFGGAPCEACAFKHGRHPRSCPRCKSSGSEERAERPRRIADVLSVACDLKGMETAELLAQQFLETMRPWGLPSVSRVCWSFEDPYGSWESPSIGLDWYALEQWLEKGRFPRPALADRVFRGEGLVVALPLAMRAHFALLVHAQAAWNELEARSAFFSLPRSSNKLPEQPIETIGNPFDALLNLLATGYYVRAVHNDELVLAVPAV